MPGRTVNPVLGVIGGGQLARMMFESASELAVDLRVLSRDADESMAHSGHQMVGSPSSISTLRAFARTVHAITFDHEPPHLEPVAQLEADGVVVRPGARALAFSDKAVARRAMAAAGLPVPPFVVTRDADRLAAFAADHGWPVVAKLARGGFDGRGLVTVGSAAEAAPVVAEVEVDLVVEPVLPIDQEVSVLVVTGADGEVRTYPAVETIQERGMCRAVLLGSLGAPLAAQAEHLARQVAGLVGSVGVLAVEMFVVRGELLVNEVAPRPHNSGHLTIEASVTSQFENHIRAAMGWSLGSTATSSNAAMVNVVGHAGAVDPRRRLASAMEIPEAKVHLYAKTPRPERKIGHVTVCHDDPRQALAIAREAVRRLESEED